MHAFGLIRKRLAQIILATDLIADPKQAPQTTIALRFGLAGIGQIQACTAFERWPGPIQDRNPSITLRTVEPDALATVVTWGIRETDLAPGLSGWSAAF